MGKDLVTKTRFAALCGVSAAAVTKFTKGPGKASVVGSRIDLEHPAARKYLENKTAPRPAEPAPGVDPLFETALEGCRAEGRFTASAVRRVCAVGYVRSCRIFDQLQAAGHVPEAEKREAPAPPSGQSKAPPAPTPPRKHGKGKKTAWEDEAQIVEVPEDIGDLADLTLRELVRKFGTEYRFLDWLKSLKEIESVNEKRIKNAQSTGRLVSRKLVETGVIDVFNSAHLRIMTDGAKAVSAAVIAKHAAGVPDAEIEAHVVDVLGAFIRPVKAKIERNLRGG